MSCDFACVSTKTVTLPYSTCLATLYALYDTHRVMKHALLRNTRCGGAGEAKGGWHDSKVALLSAAVFAPAAGAMMVNAYLSKRAQERHYHGCLPVFAAGLCLV